MLWVGMAWPAAAEQALSNLSAPNFENFGVKDGLSDEIYSSVGMDSRGFVWAGSASGLYRFDGYRWQRQDVEGASSLVRDMLTNPEGHLWAIFEREGLAVNRAGAWSLTGDETFFHRFNSSLDTDGNVSNWLAEDNRVFRLEGNQWVANPEWVPPGNKRITSVAQTQDILGGSRLWVARTRGQLWSRALDDPESQWEATDTGDFNGALYTDLVVSSSNGLEELWVLSYGNGILRLRSDGQLQRWRKDDGPLPSEAIYSGVVTYNDAGVRSLWLASRGGLLRFRNDEFSVFDRSDGLPSNAVRGIKRISGRSGNDILWLATERGVTRLRLAASAWRTVSRHGASENGVFGVAVDQDDNGNDRVVIGSGMAGLAVFSGGTWTPFNRANGRLPSDKIRGVWPISRAGDLVLVSMDNGRLFILNKALELTEVEIDWPVGRVNGPIDVVEAFGEIWIGTLDSAIYRLQGQEVEQVYSPVLDDVMLQALDVQVEKQGNEYVWGATNRGVVRIDEQGYELIEAQADQPDRSYRDVEVVQGGATQVLWASTERDGVVRFDITDPRRPLPMDDSDRPAAPDPTIYSVRADSRGRIYVCTNNGVQQLTPGPDGGYTERVFRRSDGLVHDECNSRSQFIDQQDRFWVGTLAGVSVYDPALEQPDELDRTPSPLHLTRIELDGRPQAADDLAQVNIGAGIEAITIHATLLSQRRETENEYRFTLLDGDDWRDQASENWDRQPFRVLPAPAPGSYTMRIEARDFSGVLARPVEVLLQVEPGWFERPLVRTTLVVSTLILLFCFAALYTRQLRQRKKALEALVDERTEDLAKANRQLVGLSFRDPLTGAANRRRLDLAGRDELNRACEKNQPVSLILFDLDRFKQFNDHHGHLAGDLALKCVVEQVAAAIRPGDLIARFGGEEFACLLPDTDSSQAAEIAERAREAVMVGSASALGERYEALTISAGVATSRPGETKLEDLIERADRALYQAKGAGRNRVINSNGQPA